MKDERYEMTWGGTEVGIQGATEVDIQGAIELVLQGAVSGLQDGGGQSGGGSS